MLPFKPLLAVDWLEIVIFLFIITSSLVGQLFKAAQQRKKDRPRKPKPPKPAAPDFPPARRQPQPQAPPQVPPQAPPVAGQPKTSLEKEIEAFLRKTLGKEEPAKPAPAKPKPGKRPIPQPPRKPSTIQRPARAKPKPSTDFRPQETVGQHVQRHIQSGGVGQRDAHLGEVLGQSDERMESHLHDVFDHRLGTLADEEKRLEMGIAEGTDAQVWEAHQAANPLTSQLYQILSTPQQVQAAVILTEILRRPEERWS